MSQVQTTDYSNRQIDLEIMQTIVKPASITMLALSLTQYPVKAVTGMQKLAQRFAVTFLTQLGDVHFDQTFGTEFWSNLVHGSGQNTGQLRVVLTLASSEAAALISNDDVDAVYGIVPADEQLANATLLDFNVDTATGTLYLQIGLTSKAGDSYVYVVPLPLTGSGT